MGSVGYCSNFLTNKHMLSTGRLIGIQEPWVGLKVSPKSAVLQHLQYYMYSRSVLIYWIYYPSNVFSPCHYSKNIAKSKNNALYEELQQVCVLSISLLTERHC